MKHGKINKSVFRGFFFNQILAKQIFLSYVFNFYDKESRLIPGLGSWNKQQNSGFWVLAVGFARDSLQDFRWWITVFERGLAICLEKNILTKVEKDKKDDVECQKSRRRIEGRNVKKCCDLQEAGIESRSSSELTCCKNAGSKPREEGSICTFKPTSTSNKISFPTNGG